MRNWLYFLFGGFKRKPQLSKNAVRRLRHTSVVYEGEMVCRDGRPRYVRWLRFDVGRFLDRSKYNGDGSPK